MNKHGGYVGESKNIRDHSININPFDLPKEIKELIQKKIDVLGNYPELDGKKSAEKLSNHMKIDSSNLILGNGATELIYLFARAMKFQNALLVEPTFSEYRRAFRLAETKIHRKYLLDENYGFDIRGILKEIKEKRYDVLVICRPNNPTGKCMKIEDLKTLINELKKNKTWLFLDESFIEFSDQESFLENGKLENIFILHSMTKIFGVPGLRIGYGISDARCIEELYKNKEPWTLNTFALGLIEEIELLERFGEKTKREIKRQKRKVFSELSEIEAFEIFETETNFIFGKMKSNTAIELQTKLIDRNYYIRTCEEFFGLDDSFFRIAIRTQEENTGLIQAIRESVEELKCQN